MAAGLPVVSTRVGAEGLAVTDGRDIWLADDADGFARQVLELLNNPAERKSIAAERFSWDAVTERFEQILQAARSV
jgi:glycosyltransferase involved in cell wall biosynthesis